MVPTLNSPGHNPPKDYPYFRRTWNMVVITLLAAAFIPLIIIGGGMYSYLAFTLEQETVEALRAEALELKDTVDQFLAERTVDLRLISQNIGVAGLSYPDTLQTVFTSLQQQVPCFTDLGVIDNEGRHLAYVGPYDLLSKNYSRAEWFQIAMARGVFISDVFLGHRNVPHFVIAVKQETPAGAWFLRATIDTDYFHRMISAIAAKRKATAYFVNRLGRYQTCPHAEVELMQSSPIVEPQPFEGVAFHEQNDRLTMTVWLKNADWLCVVQMDRKDAFADLWRIRAIGIWAFVLGAILMIMTVLLTTNHLVSRLEVKRRSIRFLDRQLRQSNRLASAMELSFGFFREVKDSLANIHAAAANCYDLAQNNQLQGMAESLTQIRTEADRSRTSIDKFLRFTHSAEPIIKDVRVNEVLEDLIDVLDKELRLNNIDVIRNYAASLPAIRSDPAELRQVFQNLIMNAMTAIQTNGTITLTTQREPDGVVITVTDTGPGIDAQHLAKIFEPLFTTKPGGTGLGLPICADILERLGGQITAHNVPEDGACFVVRLPLRFARPIETRG